LLPALVGLAWLAYSRGLSRLRSSHHTAQPTTRRAAWVLYLTLAVLCIPRMQEVIYPDHLFALPGQSDPHAGWLVLLARSGVLLYTALATLIAGAVLLRTLRIQ